MAKKKNVKKTSTVSADGKTFTQATLVDGRVYAPGEAVPNGKQTKAAISEPEAEVVDPVEVEPEAE